MSLKKIFIILIILLILIIAALLIYNFVLKPEAPAEPGAPSAPSALGQINPVSQEAVLGPTIDNQKVKYYLASNGNVFKSNFDGSQLTQVSSNLLTGLLKVLWSPDKDKVIAVFDDEGQTKKYFYDYDTQIATLLNEKIRWLVWSPVENRIAYQYYDEQTEDNNISIANPDGSNWINVFSTRMKDLIVEWPNSSQLAVRTKPSGLAQSAVYMINLSNGNFQKIINDRYGLTVLWSPLGNKLLLSETDQQGKNMKLKIADLAESTIEELNFVTLPEKCTWSQDNRTVFCAVPKTISKLAVLPDDYYKGVISFTDDFWQINLDTGEARQIFEAGDTETNGYDAQELFLSPLEDYLLFVNQKDGLLYSLEL